MQLKEIIHPATTFNKAQVDSKKSILSLISKLFAEQLGIAEHEKIFECLVAREKLGSTGIGHGVALPHGRYAEITQPIATLVSLDKPIDFNAVDGEPVDLFCALLVPREAENEHLIILSQLAEMFSKEVFRNKLRNAKDDKELYNLFVSD